MKNNETIIPFLSKHRRRTQFARISSASCIILAVELFLCSLFSAAFSIFPWIGLPYLFDLSIFVTIVLIVFIVSDKTVFHPTSLENTALNLEKHSGRSHQWLSIALEFLNNPPSHSTQLTGQVFLLCEKELDGYPKHLNPLVKRDRLVLLSAALAVFSVCAVFLKPQITAYLDVPVNSQKAVKAAVYPGSISMPQFAACTLRCHINNKNIPSTILSITNAFGKPGKTRFLLKPDKNGDFQHVVNTAAESFLYSFSMGRTLLNTDTISVVRPPKLTSLKIRLVYPEYTGQKPLMLSDGKGTFSAMADTRAEITIGSHFPLVNALLVSRQKDTINLTVNDSFAKGVLVLSHQMDYSFVLTDSLLQTSDSLPFFNIEMLPDIPPYVRILKPGKDISLSPALKETLVVDGIDDFGIKSISCNWRKNTDAPDTFSVWNLFAENSRKKAVRIQAVWDLRALSLYPGDTVFYWAAVTDNKPGHTRQTDVSDTFWFRLPGFEEIHKNITDNESYAEQTMESVREKQADLKKDVEKMIASSKKQKPLTWEEKKALENIDRNLSAQADSLKQAVTAMDNAIKQMKEQDGLSPQLLKKMEEVREAVKQLTEQYGDSLLFSKQDNTQPMDWKDIKKSLDKLKDMLPDLEKQLDNTLDFLKNLARDREIAQLAVKAQKLAQRQLEQTGKTDKASAMAQKELSRDIDNLAAELDSITSQDESRKPFDKADIPSLENIRDLANKPENNTGSLSMPQMSQMSSALMSLSRELENQLSSSMMLAMQKDRDLLMEMAGDALDMSKWQSEISEASGSMASPVNAARQQALIDALKKAAQKLDSLSMLPPWMIKKISSSADNALSSMKQAMEGAGNKKSSGFGAEAGLNNFAFLLMSASEMMNSQSSKSSQSGEGQMMSGLKKLSKSQAAINSMTMEMLKQMLGQGESGSGTINEEHKKAAQQAQQKLAEELRNLANQSEKEGGGGVEQAIRDLESEARKIAQMLEKPDMETADRQERFLVRMLQISLSMHKQNEGNDERKSSSAAVTFLNSIPTGEKMQETGIDAFYRIRSQALTGNFPEDYRVQVQSYFDSLGVLFLKE